MKIYFYSRPRADISGETLGRALAAPAKYGFEWAVNDEYATAAATQTGIVIPASRRYHTITPDQGAVMVSVGGDGTFLEAVARLGGIAMPIFGVNLGHLGFLAQIRPSDISRALEDIVAGRYSIERRTMILVEGDFGVPVAFPCALNEFTLHRHTADMIEVELRTGGGVLAVIRGDGVIISTPTGSTAYSLSAGGPILAPDCACLLWSAIAPHNFSVRPLVLPDSSTISLEVRTRGREVRATLDNNSFIVGDGARFVIKKSQFAVFLAHVQNISFYDTLRDRIMWGLDRRDGGREGFPMEF